MFTLVIHIFHKLSKVINNLTHPFTFQYFTHLVTKICLADKCFQMPWKKNCLFLEYLSMSEMHKMYGDIFRFYLSIHYLFHLYSKGCVGGGVISSAHRARGGDAVDRSHVHRRATQRHRTDNHCPIIVQT